MASRLQVAKATQDWLLSSDNTPEEQENWNKLYDLIHARPPGSVNATKEELAPVMLP